MSMQNLLEAFSLIEDHQHLKDVSGSKSDELIQKAEQVLGLKFPPTYRLFLKAYGCGGIGSLEIYGLTKSLDTTFQNTGVPDGIWSTLRARNKVSCPHSFIIIGTTGFGPDYVLDSLQADQNGEYPVLLWMGGLPEAPTKKVNSDFGEFLLEQVQQQLADEYENNESN